MATISELMEGKKPGEIRICSVAERLIFYTPYYWDRDSGFWYGTNDKGRSDCFGAAIDKWEIYTEPKKKVVWYEYLVSSNSVGCRTEWTKYDIVPTSEKYKYTKTGRTVEVEGE